jgi:hypothetical protein
MHPRREVLLYRPTRFARAGYEHMVTSFLYETYLIWPTDFVPPGQWTTADGISSALSPVPTHSCLGEIPAT